MRTSRLFSFATLLFVISLTVVLFLFRDSWPQLVAWGYFGIFLVAILGNATLLLPAPVLVLVFIAGGNMPSPLLVGLAAGLGSAIGEFNGYLAGYSGSELVTRTKVYAQYQALIGKYGVWAIGVLAFIPNPLFDLVGIIGGALKIPWYKFGAATLVGKTLKTVLVAYAGSYSVEWVRSFIG